MYTMTEVELTDPALLALFDRLSQVLGRDKGDDLSELSTLKDELVVATLAWHDGKPVGCGLLRRDDSKRVELKRLYSIQPGVGKAVLHYLEQSATKQGFESLVVAVRIINSKTINYFLERGFKKIPSFGKYRYSSQMLCLEKPIAGAN